MKSTPVLAAAVGVSMTVLMARHRCIRAQFFSVCLKITVQLIFSTHDKSLLDVPDLFRGDQVWFVDRLLHLDLASRRGADV